MEFSAKGKDYKLLIEEMAETIYGKQGIDDWQEYKSRDGEKIIVTMSPPGELLFFKVKKYDDFFVVEFLASSWKSKERIVSEYSEEG